MTNGKYILDGHTPVLEPDLFEWARRFETAERHVCNTEIKTLLEKFINWVSFGKFSIGETIRISTVFLGLDHSFGDGEPLLFETMVFGGALNGQMERYSTWDKAAEGHKHWVEKAKGKRR